MLYHGRFILYTKFGVPSAQYHLTLLLCIMLCLLPLYRRGWAIPKRPWNLWRSRWAKQGGTRGFIRLICLSTTLLGRPELKHVTPGTGFMRCTMWAVKDSCRFVSTLIYKIIATANCRSQCTLLLTLLLVVTMLLLKYTTDIVIFLHFFIMSLLYCYFYCDAKYIFIYSLLFLLHCELLYV